MTGTETPTRGAPARSGPDRRWLAVGAILLAAALDMIDTTIVNIALPALHDDLKASEAALQWTVAGYTLAFAMFLITAGRLGDIYGHRKLLLGGIAGFVLSSLTCGIAQSPEMLIGSRVAQGLFAAMVMTQALSVFQITFEPKERGAVFALFGALTGLSAVLGPVLGGVLVNADLWGLGWRTIFLVNVPIGLLALIGAALWVRPSRSPSSKLDIPGVVLVSAALLALLYPLIQGPELDWPTWTYVSMIGSVPLLIVFVLYERAKSRRDGAPLVQLSLFADRSFVAGLIVLLTFFAAMASFFFPLTFFLQAGLGMSPLRAGLTIAPYSVAAMITSGMSANLATKLGRNVLSIGIVIKAAGILILAYTIQHADGDVTTWTLMPGMIVAGLGLGMVVAPIVDVILAGVPVRYAGTGSGMLNTADQLGAAAGVAVIGVLFFSMLGAQAGPAATDVGGRLRGELVAAGVDAPTANRISTQLFRACATGAADFQSGKSPAACQQMMAALPPRAAAKAGPVLAKAGTDAQKLAFARSTVRMMLYVVLILAVSFLATFLLPRRTRPHGQPAVAAAGAKAGSAG